MIAKNIKIHRLEDLSPEWLEFRRMNGIGSSEIGTLLGLNPDESAIELFYKKLGVTGAREMNAAMFWGRQAEDMIADAWQYYDGTPEGYVDNYEQGKMLRKCHRINGIMQNMRIPWLLMDVDRAINKGGFNLLSGEVLEQTCPLEIKTINVMAKKKWEEGVPPYHLAQVCLQMAIMEVDYGEIVLWDNFRELTVIGISRTPAVQKFIDEIEIKSKEFWEQRVLPARKIADKEGFTDIETQDVPADIQLNLEPEPDTSEAYKDFLSHTARLESRQLEGGEEEWQKAKQLKVLKAIENEVGRAINLRKNQLMKLMSAAHVNEMIFTEVNEAEGRLQWKPAKNKPKPIFNNYIKYTVPENLILNLVEDIDLNL